MTPPIDRRKFMQWGVSAGVGVVAGCRMATGPGGFRDTGSAASMMEFRDDPRQEVKVGYVGIGNMGSNHLRNLLKIPGCRVAAVCDIRPERTEWAKTEIVKAGFPEPAVYGKDDRDFRRMCENEDLDLVYTATPWRWHTPVCLAAMENGKHAASEVPICLWTEDCWKLVETSERTHRYCIMMENCCYDYTEMLLLNMIQQGLFGEILHGECGYLHDLRALKLSPDYYQGMWRINHSLKRNGNNYPTHGIGPMAWCMDIHRGDAFDYLVSMSTPARGLNEFAERMATEAADAKLREHYAKWMSRNYALGDVNVSLIKTKKGKTIICNHDTNLPRPYSRAFLVQGTRGLARKYPEEKIYLEGKSPADAWEGLDGYREQYEHPVWKRLKEDAHGAGHGGMDYIEDYRLIQALRNGWTPDIDVYDSAAWSVIVELSEKSANNGSQPVEFPDFTRGAWQTPRALGVSVHV